MNPNQLHGNMPKSALMLPDYENMNILMALERPLLGPSPTFGQPVTSFVQDEPTGGQQSPDYTGEPMLHLMGPQQQVVSPILPQQLDHPIPLGADLSMDQDWEQIIPSPSPPPSIKLNRISIPHENGQPLSERDGQITKPMNYSMDEPMLQQCLTQPLRQPRHQYPSGRELLPTAPRDQHHAFQIGWNLPPQADPPSLPQAHHQMPVPSTAPTPKMPTPSIPQHQGDNDTTAMTLFQQLKNTIYSTEVACSQQAESSAQNLPYPDVNSLTTTDGDSAISCSQPTMCLQAAQARDLHFTWTAAARLTPAQ